MTRASLCPSANGRFPPTLKLAGTYPRAVARSTGSSRSGELSFSRNSRAPAASARPRRPPCVLIATAGIPSSLVRARSRPRPSAAPRIWTPTIATAGASSRARSKAAAALSASATTSKPGDADRKLRSAVLTLASPSAIRTRTAPVPSSQVMRDLPGSAAQSTQSTSRACPRSPAFRLCSHATFVTGTRQNGALVLTEAGMRSVTWALGLDDDSPLVPVADVLLVAAQREVDVDVALGHLFGGGAFSEQVRSVDREGHSSPGVALGRLPFELGHQQVITRPE